MNVGGAPARLGEDLRYIVERGSDDAAFFGRWWLDWTPHAGQVLWCEQEADRAFLITGRRWGKSHAASFKALRGAFYRGGSRLLNCSITMDQARIVFDRCVEMATRSPRFSALVADVVYSPFPRLRLVNGAEIWCRSTQRNCQFIRGHSFDWINYDEVTYGVKSDLDVLLPCLIDRSGAFNGTSTPRGQNWVYFDVERTKTAHAQDMAALARVGLTGVDAVRAVRSFFHRGSTYENSYIPREAIDRLAADMPELSRRQEIEGEFVPTAGTLFAYENVVRMECPDLALPWDGNDPQLVPHVPGEDEGITHGWRCIGGGNEVEAQGGGIYVVGADLGRKKSWTVGFALRVDCTPWRIVERVRLHRQPWQVIAPALRALMSRWRATALFDSTGLGDAVLAFEEFRGLPIEGYNFGVGGPTGSGGTRSKVDLLVCLQRAVQAGLVVVPFYPELHDQLLLYTWDEAEKSEDQTFDDLFALALAVWHAMSMTPGALMVASSAGRVLDRLSARGDHDPFRGF